MKKISLIGASVMCAASVLAMTPERAGRSVSGTVGNEPLFGEGVSAAAMPAKMIAQAPAKAVSSPDDLTGMRKATGIMMHKDPNGPTASVINVDVSRKGNVSLRDYPFQGAKIIVDVDLDNMTVTIPNEVYAGQEPTQHNEVYIYTYTYGAYVRDEDDGLYKYRKDQGPKACENAVGKILADGTFDFTGYVLVASNPTLMAQNQIFYALNTLDVKMSPLEFATPDVSTFEYIGEGNYKDCFFSPALNSDIKAPVKKVKLYAKQNEYKNGVLIAAEDPYLGVRATLAGQTTLDFWRHIGMMFDQAEGKGYLLFDLKTGPEYEKYGNVAVMRMLVASGMEMDDSREQDGTNIQMRYLFNEEGFAAFAGEESLLNTLDRYRRNGIQCSNVDSWNVINIRNTYFGFTDDPVGPYWYGEDVAHPVGTLDLPDNWKTSGVHFVAADGSEDATVRYYNLQGMEIAAPVPGQLTIRRQGNKSTKFIAR